MEYIKVKMPDGFWVVPVDIIADNRAKYFAERDSDTTYEEEFNYTMSSHDEISDWAKDNMNWSDVQKFARKLDSKILTKDDFEESWMNNDFEFVDEEDINDIKM